VIRDGEMAMETAGVVTAQSRVSVSEAIDRIVTGAARSYFVRPHKSRRRCCEGRHAAPSDGLVIFGHPRGSTPLMQDRQTAGIDLPVKALAWEDAEGNVWLTYNDARWIMRRHSLGPQSVDAVNAIAAGLSSLAEEATAS